MLALTSSHAAALGSVDRREVFDAVYYQGLWSRGAQDRGYEGISPQEATADRGPLFSASSAFLSATQGARDAVDDVIASLAVKSMVGAYSRSTP